MTKSYDKLFSILEYVKEHPRVKLQTMASELGMSKSTLHRIVTELVEYAFLTRDERQLTYRLGTKLLELGSTVIEQLDLRTDSADIIRELNEKTLETIHLAMLVDHRVVYVNKCESRHAVRMYSLVGKEAPIHCTGVGKAILAFRKPEEIDEMLARHPLPPHTASTITDRGALMKEFENIRAQGVSFDREEHEEGIICIAAPIRDHLGEVSASISITTITQRMSLGDLNLHRDALLSAANSISRSLGYLSGGKL